VIAERDEGEGRNECGSRILFFPAAGGGATAMWFADVRTA